MSIDFLIPVYRQEPCLLLAIDSCLKELEGNDKLILIFDGFSLRSESLDDSILDNNRIVKLYTGKRVGPGAAIDLGINYSTNEFIAFLGEDDICIQGRVKSQSKLLAEGKYAFVASNPALINNEGKSITHKSAPVFFPAKSSGSRILSISDMFGKPNFICAPTVTAKRDIIKKFSHYCLALPRLHDYYLWMLLLMHGHKGFISSQPVSSYRIHERNFSIGKSAKSSYWAEIMYIYTNILSTLPDSVLCKDFNIVTPWSTPFEKCERELYETLILLLNGSEYCVKAGKMKLVATTASYGIKKVVNSLGCLDLYLKLLDTPVSAHN